MTKPHFSAAKPTLLILTSTYPRWKGDHEPGFVHELARRLVDQFDVHVVGPHAPGASSKEVLDAVKVTRYRYAPERLETLVNDGGIMTNLRRQRWKWLLLPSFVLAQMLAMHRALRRVKPDVVHAHWLLPQGLTVASLSLLRELPFVVTSHGADLFSLRAAPFQLLKRWVCKRAAALTVVSEAMRDALRDLGVPPPKIYVHPMGVDLRARFTPDEKVARDPDQLLFVGRLVEKKGVQYLIKSLPLILRDHPNVKLAIAGFGPEEPALRKQVEALGLNAKVHFLGAVPQAKLPPLYRGAGLFVAPFVEAGSGDQEGLGLVTVEGIGCGCSVLVGDVPAVRDVVPDESRRVRSADPEELARVISDILSQPAKDRADRAEKFRQEIIARFDWDVVAAGYSSLLKKSAGIPEL